MKASELRIGNFIAYEEENSDTYYYVVSAIVANEICCSHPGENINVPLSDMIHGTNWMPIPLTDGWMERMGFTIFKQDGVKAYQLPINEKYIAWGCKTKFELSGNEVIQKPQKQLEKVNFCVNGWWATHPLKYVHEIQNAYYAITGEELEIK